MKTVFVPELRGEMSEGSNVLNIDVTAFGPRGPILAAKLTGFCASENLDPQDPSNIRPIFAAIAASEKLEKGEKRDLTDFWAATVSLPLKRLARG